MPCRLVRDSQSDRFSFVSAVSPSMPCRLVRELQPPRPGVVAEEKQGCHVTLTWNADSATFTGGTTGQGCASSLNDASYAASEVTLGADRLVSWDRGFDDKGKQVWGATKGGYVFDRLSEAVLP